MVLNDFSVRSHSSPNANILGSDRGSLSAALVAGTPTLPAGQGSLAFDTVNMFLYVFVGAAWVKVIV